MATFFSANYLISVLSGLTAGFLMNKATPHANPYVKFFLLPLLVSYVVLKIMNTLFPSIAGYAGDFADYVGEKTYSHINSLGFFEIYPILFATFIIFIILLYSGTMH